MFWNLSIYQNKTIRAGGGLECKKFRMFESVKAVDVEVNYPEVGFEPGVTVLIEFIRLRVKVKEVKKSRGPKRVSVLRRLRGREGRRVVRSEPSRDGSVALERTVGWARGAMNIATGSQ